LQSLKANISDFLFPVGMPRLLGCFSIKLATCEAVIKKILLFALNIDPVPSLPTLSSNSAVTGIVHDVQNSLIAIILYRLAIVLVELNDTAQGLTARQCWQSLAAVC